jgi:hypothetical protein
MYYACMGRTAGTQAVEDAIGVLEAEAMFGSDVYTVPVRVAEHADKIFLDLADPQWRVIEIGCNVWEVVSESSMRFRRNRTMLALPEPKRGATLDALRPFVNVKTDADWLLLLAWLLAALRPQGPYPCLVLTGEQGTAKSTLGRTLQRLIDPNAGDLRYEPKEARDLAIAANGAWVVAYDNLSHLPQWLSDALCRLATGGGFSTRQLYTDDEEVIFNAKRPVILTSITDVVIAGDLMDRSVTLQLEHIPEEQRKTEQQFDAAFSGARPHILGAILDAVAAGLRLLPTLQMPRLPRMADFQVWAEACLQGAGYPAGAFTAAYEGNRRHANRLVLEASPVATALLKLLDVEGPFEGTSDQLLTTLNARRGEGNKPPQGWPAKPHVLSGHLKRIAPNLRKEGVDLTWSLSHHPRTIRAERRRDGASPASLDDPKGDAGDGGDAPSRTCSYEDQDDDDTREPERGDAWEGEP